MERMGFDRRELHRRLARRWGIVSSLTTKGSEYVARAIEAQPSSATLAELRFLQTLLRVYKPTSEALAQFHGAVHHRLAGTAEPTNVSEQLRKARRNAEQAQRMAAEAFPNPIDPSGGEIGSLRRYLDRLVSAIADWQRDSEK